MTYEELGRRLECFDYTGTLPEVLARMTDEALDQLHLELNANQADHHLYFGLRRYRVETGSPADEEVSNTAGLAILSAAVNVLTVARMHRRGTIEVLRWPDSPFAHPDQIFEVRQTAATAEQRNRLHNMLKRHEQN
jgi:hypothetical protein